MDFLFLTLSLKKTKKNNMSCNCSKDCDSHQNSSFIFGLIIGLIISAIVAVVIYKNNKEKVFTDFKKYLEIFLNTFKPKSEEIIKNKKKDVVIPKNLIIANNTPKPTFPKAKKMFKK